MLGYLVDQVKEKGVTRRKKIGRRGDAIAAYRDRKTWILQGRSCRADAAQSRVRFTEVGKEAIDCTADRQEGPSEFFAADEYRY